LCLKFVSFTSFTGTSADNNNPLYYIAGWTDLFHNYYLLGSLMEVGTHSLKLLKEAGRDEDLKCLTIDAVNFTQHCGLISRLENIHLNRLYYATCFLYSVMTGLWEWL